MKKTILKPLCIIIPIIIVLSVCGIIFFNMQKEPGYYVINGGTGDGKNAKNPAGSVLEVIKTINADGYTSNDTVNIYIMQRDDYKVYPKAQNHNKTYWAKDGAKPENHTAKILVQPYSLDKATELAYSDTLNENQIIQLSGPTIFKNIKIVGLKESNNKQLVINGNDLFIDRDVSFDLMTFDSSDANEDNKSYHHTFNLTSTEDTVYKTPINLEFKHTMVTQSSIYIGNSSISALSSTIYPSFTFEEDTNILINYQDYESNNKVSYPIIFNSNAKFNKNLNFYIKNAEEIKFDVANNAKVEVAGGIQLLYNSFVKIPANLNTLNCFSDNTKIWSIAIEPSAEDCIELSSVAGTYNITKDIILTAINSNGDTVISKDKKLTLDAGEWTVSKKTIIHYGDANSDGVLDSKDVDEIESLISQNKYYPPADINCDNLVDSSDIALLKEHLAGTKTIEWEKYDIELCETLNLSGGADKEAEKLKNTILSAKDTISTSSENTTYYVASDGDPFSEGISPEEPMSFDAVEYVYLNPGDVVLFKRGDVFRLTKPIKPQNGVSYGAYGEGDKPQFLGSAKDYADAGIWSSQDSIIWETKIPDGLGAANMIFDNGKATGYRKMKLEDVKNDGDFYFDSSDNTLYLKLNQYNPGHYFDSIEIANVQFIFQATGSGELNLISDMYFENLCLKYPSTHAFSLNFGENISIQNCEMSWIGGDWYGDEGTRLGNAVEFWAIAKGNNVSNNYIYQVFDAAITFQGMSSNIYTDLTFENNLIEYCSMNFEFWAKDDTDITETSADPTAEFKNISVSKNIFRFGGLGYSGFQRNGKTDQSYILAWHNSFNDGQFKDFNITENIFDITNSYYFYGPDCLHHINIDNNSYYQKAGSENKSIRYHHFYSEDKDSFKTAITSIDKNPKSIKWIN